VNVLDLAGYLRGQWAEAFNSARKRIEATYVMRRNHLTETYQENLRGFELARDVEVEKVLRAQLKAQLEAETPPRAASAEGRLPVG
jgi:hypothetical protein